MTGRKRVPEDMANEDKMQTVAGAICEMSARGFTQDLAVDGDRVKTRGGGKMFRSADVIVREHRRFEGVSDPDDTAVVYAIEAADGTRGVLVDGYGVYADPEVAAFLVGVPVDQPAVKDPQIVHPPFELLGDL